MSAEHSGSRTCRGPPAGQGLVVGTSVFTGLLAEWWRWCAAQNLPAGLRADSGCPRHSGCWCSSPELSQWLQLPGTGSFSGLPWSRLLEPALPWPNVTGKSSSWHKRFSLETKMKQGNIRNHCDGSKPEGLTFQFWRNNQNPGERPDWEWIEPVTCRKKLTCTLLQWRGLDFVLGTESLSCPGYWCICDSWLLPKTECGGWEMGLVLRSSNSKRSWTYLLGSFPLSPSSGLLKLSAGLLMARSSAKTPGSLSWT